MAIVAEALVGPGVLLFFLLLFNISCTSAPMKELQCARYCSTTQFERHFPFCVVLMREDRQSTGTHAFAFNGPRELCRQIRKFLQCCRSTEAFFSSLTTTLKWPRCWIFSKISCCMGHFWARASKVCILNIYWRHWHFPACPQKQAHCLGSKLQS